uniref:F-box domain-containing protein n=1 Tax=Caenorhabditis tropicalis TaxID=1561998 RepID=A0A1I7UW07_9PELO
MGNYCSPSFSMPISNLRSPKLKTAPPFPLFGLPLVAYKNIIDLMTSAEQVSLSFCSRRTNSIIKYIRHRPETLTLWIQGRNRVLVKVSHGHYKAINTSRQFFSVLGAKKKSRRVYRLETISIKGHIVPVKVFTKKDGSQYLETYWNDKNYGLRVIGDYVCDLFRQDLLAVKLVEDHIELFEWVHNRQPSITQITLAKKISDEDFKYIASKSNTKLLLGNTSLSKNFRIEKFNKKADVIGLVNCHWMTVENIMELNTGRIEIRGKTFTNKELNRILKHWINGGSPYLNHLRLCLDKPNDQEYLDGIVNNRIEGDPNVRFYSALYHSEYIFNNVGLERADGTKASFKVYRDNSIFVFVVWPDAKGRTFESFD